MTNTTYPALLKALREDGITIPRIAARARKLADQIAEDGYIDDEKAEALADSASTLIDEVEGWARSWGAEGDTLTLIEGIRADCARLEVDLTDLEDLNELLTAEAERLTPDTEEEENTMTNELNATQPLALQENTMTHSTALSARIASLNRIAADIEKKNLAAQDSAVRCSITGFKLRVYSFLEDRDEAAVALMGFPAGTKDNIVTMTRGTHAPRVGAFDALVEYLRTQFPNANIEAELVSDVHVRACVAVRATAGARWSHDEWNTYDRLVGESIDEGAEDLFDKMMIEATAEVA